MAHWPGVHLAIDPHGSQDPAIMASAAVLGQDQRPGSRQHGSRGVGLWLLVCGAMVFGAVIIGGITRLTESGLSITQWQPFSGVLPPLTDADWRALFALYQATPEFQKVNSGMDLSAFKQIFWWEYGHRLWGRLIGVVFLVPLIWFAVRGAVGRRLGLQLAGLFVLGGLQGALGWFMVQSGLVDNPDVSQYRLAAHLGLALVLYSAILWLAFDNLSGQPELMPDSRLGGLRRLAGVTAVVLAVTILSGALMAGTRAGLTYNTFPLMDGRLVPRGYFVMNPWLVNPFENVTAIQFNHRLLATITLVVAAVTWWRSRWVVLPARARLAANCLALAALGQVALGITTLLLVVPIPLAAAHQGFAVVLLSCVLWLLHELRWSRHGNLASE